MSKNKFKNKLLAYKDSFEECLWSDGIIYTYHWFRLLEYDYVHYCKNHNIVYVHCPVLIIVYCYYIENSNHDHTNTNSISRSQREV